MGTRNLVLEATKVLGAFYIDAVETTLVINAPFVCRAVWALVSPFLTQRQKNKMRVVGSMDNVDNLAALHATVSPEILPASLGGSADPDFWGHAAQGVHMRPHATVDTRDFLSSWLSCCIARDAKLQVSSKAESARIRRRSNGVNLAVASTKSADKEIVAKVTWV